jgi:hypothetical protein
MPFTSDSARLAQQASAGKRRTKRQVNLQDIVSMGLSTVRDAMRGRHVTAVQLQGARIALATLADVAREQKQGRGLRVVFERAGAALAAATSTVGSDGDADLALAAGGPDASDAGGAGAGAQPTDSAGPAGEREVQTEVLGRGGAEADEGPAEVS